MKKVGIICVVLIASIILSCQKKDTSIDETAATTTGGTTTTGSPAIDEGSLIKFLNKMTDGNAKAWELVEYKDSLGNALSGLGSKLVFAKATSSVFPNTKPNPADTTLPRIIDNENGYVILGTYGFAPNSSTTSQSAQMSAVSIVNGIPSTFSQGGPPNFDNWSVLTSTSCEFKMINVAYSLSVKNSVRKYSCSSIPAGFVPPTPSSTFCPIGIWTKTDIGCLKIASLTISQDHTATLNDWTCDGSLNRIVTWTWTESNGYIDWTYKSYKVDNTDVLPLPAPEHTPYTCSSNSFSSGGVTWHK